jgi:predicted ribosomally synthesized peptide with SipW-like signal peptide
MNKRLIISLSIIGVVVAIVGGVTYSLFNDTETSAGNILVAGTMDLKVDHLRETYNDVDCKTCSVNVVSDISNQVMRTIGGIDQGPFPHSAVLVSPLNPAWTANIPGAQWIWWTNPTPEAEKEIDTIYTFEKTFNWMGPVTGATMVLSIGADNSYEIYLNGHYVAGDNTEQNYNAAGQDTYTGAVISNWIVQGTNTLQFKVKNWARPHGQTWDNPGGLLYKLAIDGNCDNDYFKTHCTLWGEKDIAPGDYFWRFSDVKPGDHGTNVISMHVFNNNAFGCLLVNNTHDNENNLIDPESQAGDTTNDPDGGELSQFINVFAWTDNNQNGIYEPTGETQLLAPNTPIKDLDLLQLSLQSTTTAYVGLAWCVGTQSVSVAGVISCSGAGDQDIAQTDSFLASLTAYAEQERNNPNFNCANVTLP